jgi:hypothetical protein
MEETHNQLLDKHSLADTSTTEETNLSTTSIGSQKIDDFDTGNQDFGGCGLLNKLGGVGVDRRSLCGLDRSSLVDGVTSDVHDTTQGTWADGDTDRGASVDSFATSDETFGTWRTRIRPSNLH